MKGSTIKMDIRLIKSKIIQITIKNVCTIKNYKFLQLESEHIKEV
jgi:hypothetical protein